MNDNLNKKTSKFSYIYYLPILLIVMINIDTFRISSGKTSYLSFFKSSTGSSIVGYDWCYPSCDEDVQSSFKFSSDGTFTFSTKTFGGMSRRGTWRDLGNGNIQTNDNQVGTQTVRILSRTRIKVGSTTYNRD